MMDRIRKATSSAFSNVHRRMYGDKDDDLRIYDSLTPRDFFDMTQEFGEDNVVEYIREMEVKRIQGRK